MKKIKVVSLVAVILVVTTTAFLWTSEKKPILVQEVEKFVKGEPQPSEKLYIQFYGKKFPVSEEVFKQFKIIKVEEEFIKKSGQRKKETGEIVERFPGKTAAGKAVGVLAEKFLGIKTWNIIPHVKTLMSDDPSKKEEEKKTFSELIELLLDIASGSLSPEEVTHASALFMIIKLADKLGNDHVMQLCAGPLMRKITGINQFQPTRCFEEHTNYINGLVFLGDGNRVLSFSHDRTIRLWDFKEKRQVRVFKGCKEAVEQVVVLPGDKQFLSRESHGIMRLWNIQDGQMVRSFGTEDQNVSKIILLKDGKHFISYRLVELPEIRLWNIESETPVRTFALEENEIFYTITVLSDNSFISYGNRIRLWNIGRDHPVRTFRLGNRLVINKIVVLNDNSFISSVGSGVYSPDGVSIILWSSKSDSPVRIFTFGFEPRVQGLVALGDDRFVSYGGRGKTAGFVNVWSVKKKDPIITFSPFEPVDKIILLEDGNRFISIGRYGAVNLWSIDERKKIDELMAGGGSLFDSRYVACLSVCRQLLLGDGSTFVLRDLETEKNIYTFVTQFQDDFVRSPHVLHGSKQFVSLLQRNPVICLWDIDPFENLTFEQIDLCYDLFKRKIEMSAEDNPKEFKTFQSLPSFLCDEIIKRKLFKEDNEEE